MNNYLTILLIIFSIQTLASDYLPENILELNNKYGHHIIIVEKSTHSLFIYNNTDSIPRLIKTYHILTGKKEGNKIFQGDFRTPEGVYYFTNFIPHDKLLKDFGEVGNIYGIGAFVTNYPNAYDHISKKSGSGIWLHSTNDKTRLSKGLNSRGCVVAANKDLINISKYIELINTPIIITHQLKFLTKESWLNKKEKIKKIFFAWLEAWKNKNFKEYLSFYDKKFYNSTKGNFDKFKQYKKRVFKQSDKPIILVKDITILSSNNYITITFEQHYKSKTVSDTGLKTLYLTKDSYYKYKIIAEIWSKTGLKSNKQEKSQIAFNPKQRFFKRAKHFKQNNDENKEL